MLNIKNLAFSPRTLRISTRHEESSQRDAGILATCAICYQKMCPLPPGKLCSCGQQYCESCLASWYSSQTEEFAFTGNSNFTCPSRGCQAQINPETAVTQGFRDQESAEQISDSLLRYYLRSQEDIRRCPGRGCGFAGFVSEESKSNCPGEFKCMACGYEWKDQQAGKGDSVIGADVLSDFFTTSYKNIYTEECPSCQIPILKMGGCSHMTCMKCKYEFCWYCKQKYNGHDKDLCFFTSLAKTALFFFLALAFFILTDTLPTILSQVLPFVEFMMVYGVWFNSILPILYFLLVFADDFLTFKDSQNGIYMVIMLLLLWATVSPLIHFGLFQLWLKTIVIELLCCGGVFLFAASFLDWIQEVF